VGRRQAYVAARSQAWRPILHGALAREAKRSISRIAASLETPSAPRIRHEELFPHSLAYGDAGIGLFFCYLARTQRAPRATAVARRRLSNALAGLGAVTMGPDLFHGFSGVLWCHEHARPFLWSGMRRTRSEANAFLQADQVLDRWVRTADSAELMFGVGGLCIYALERRGRNPRRLLRSAVQGLLRLARPREHGLAWPVPPKAAALIADDADSHGEHELATFLRAAGVYKPGVAHGTAGVLLALMSAWPIAGTARLREVMSLGANQLMLSAREKRHAAFPFVMGHADDQEQSGWCNGDLGIAAALVFVAVRLRRRDLYEFGLRVALSEAGRQRNDLEWFGRSNPILCHGHAGRAHLLNRLYQLTGISTFKSSAIAWYENVLALAQRNQGVGGFVVLERLAEPKSVAGFLMGAAGIGLSLLAGCSTVLPNWDRLLIGYPPSSAEFRVWEKAEFRGRTL